MATNSSPASCSGSRSSHRAGCAADRLQRHAHARRTQPWKGGRRAAGRGAQNALGAATFGVLCGDWLQHYCSMSDPQPEGQHGHLPLALRRRLGLLEHSADTVAGRVHDFVPAWLRTTRPENRLPVMLAVLVAGILQLTLPRRLSLRPRELLPALELLLLVALTVANPVRLAVQHRLLRVASTALVALITLANGASAFLLAQRLVEGTAGSDPIALLVAGGSIYLTNIIAFGLWYWEYDRGGPIARRRGERPHGDFLFAQMATPEIADHDWEPRFVDYLYVSFTNATAFSPTDTLPLSRWAKLLMAVQSTISLVTVALVVARAVNILK